MRAFCSWSWLSLAFSFALSVHTIELRPLGAFSSTVALVASSPSPSLTIVLSPPLVLPPGESKLVVAHIYLGTAKLPGLWASVPITGSGGGISHTITVGLLVGGCRVYLPLVTRY